MIKLYTCILECRTEEAQNNIFQQYKNKKILIDNNNNNKIIKIKINKFNIL